MKKFMGIQNRVAKALAVVILSVLSLCCFVLGFSGLTSKLNTTDAAASGLRAWYRFDVASNFGKDYASQAGTYTLTAYNGSSATVGGTGTHTQHYSDSYNGMRYCKGTTDNNAHVAFYASSTAADPLYGLTTSSVVSISTALYLGESVGGGNLLINNGGYDGQGGRPFAVYYTWGTLRVVLGNVEVASWDSSRIPTSSKNWYRLTIICNGTAVTVKLRDINTEKNLAPTGKASTATVTTSTQAEGTEDYYYNNNIVKYTLTSTIGSSAMAFALGGQITHSGTSCDGACWGSDMRIGDLRIYNGAMSAGEENLIAKGDRTRANSMKLVAAYESDSYTFYNEYSDEWAMSSNADNYRLGMGVDSTGIHNLGRRIVVDGTTYDNTHWDNKTMSACFQGPNSVMYAYGSTEASFYSTKTGSQKALDFSDYMRKGSFLVAIRAYVLGGKTFYAQGGTSNIGSSYYLMNTGHYGTGTGIGVSYGSITAFFSRYDGSTDSQTLSVSLGLSDSKYEWVNIVAYTSGSYIYLAAKKDGGSWVETGAVQYAGACFGGYGYSFTLGGQSNFGASIDQTCYKTGYTSTTTQDSTTAYNRTGVKMRSCKIYGGSWNNTNVNTVKTDLDNLIDIDGTSKDGSTGNEATLEAHYKFDGSTTIGADLTANGYDLVNPGNMAYSAEDGGLVLDYNNSTNPSENPNHYLYAKRGQKTSTNLDWSDKYTGSFSVAMRVKLSTAEAGRAHKIYSTTCHGGSGHNYAGSHAAYQGNTFEIMINGVVLYFYNVLDATPSWYRIFFSYNDKANEQAYLAIVFKETSAEYFIQQVKTVADMCNETLATTDVAKTAARNNNTAWTNSINTDFGGNAAYVFTIGAQSTGELGNSDTGAGSGASYYDPVISEFRFYSGVVNTAQINDLLDTDYENHPYSLDASRCTVDMNIGSNMNFNHHMRIQDNLQLSGLKVYYSFNGHTQEVAPVLDNTGDYVSTMSLMAPQDMNDIIQITQITYDRVSVTGTVSFDPTAIANGNALKQVLTTAELQFGGWDKIVNANNGYSAKQYLESIINDTSGKYSASDKATSQALLDYGTAVQCFWDHTENGYINDDGSIDSLTATQIEWLNANKYAKEHLNVGGDSVDIRLINLIFDNNLGLGLTYSTPVGADMSGYSVAIFKGDDAVTENVVFYKNATKDANGKITSFTAVNFTDTTMIDKAVADMWPDDRYMAGYEGVRLGGIADHYTFAVYNSTGTIVSKVTANAAAVIYGYINGYAYGQNQKVVNLGTALLKVYCVANGIA